MDGTLLTKRFRLLFVCFILNHFLGLVGLHYLIKVFWFFFNCSYWTSGEPNGGTRENCGDIKNYDDANSWNDESCSHSLYWVCEKKLLPEMLVKS